MDCLVNALCYMTNKMPRHLVVEPHDEQAVIEAINQTVAVAQLMATLQQFDQTQSDALAEKQRFYDRLHQSTGRAHATEGETLDDVPLIEAEPELYPYLLVLCGSCYVPLRVRRPLFLAMHTNS